MKQVKDNKLVHLTLAMVAWIYGLFSVGLDSYDRILWLHGKITLKCLAEQESSQLTRGIKKKNKIIARYTSD